MVPKKFLNLTPTPKIALKGQKSAKKEEDRVALPQQKFIVCISRFKKCYATSKIVPKGPKKFKRRPKCGQLKKR